MKNIIHNPNPTQELVLTCNQCQCKFSFNAGDTYKLANPFGGFTTDWDPTVVRCPNCGKELFVRQ